MELWRQETTIVVDIQILPEVTISEISAEPEVPVGEVRNNYNNQSHNIDLFNWLPNLLGIVILVLTFLRFFVDIDVIADFITPSFAILAPNFIILVIVPLKYWTNHPQIFIFFKRIFC